jgi:nucleotide-binding universal stress UspA family protein
MTASNLQLLVHLDPASACARRLAYARRLAQRLDAALAALYAATPGYLELPYAPEIGPSLAAELVELDAERRARTLKMFDEALATPGPLATWAEAKDMAVVPAVTQQALHADLLVLGQYERDSDAIGGVPFDFAETVLAASGRPAVVVPYIGWPGSIADAVAIAWKPTREAARAVSAALPLLRGAREVHVLTWGEPVESGIAGSPLDLVGYLRLHGVQARWHHGGPEPHALGEVLLSRAAELGADLLVMGCYGHARAREWVLGGASRTILGAMTLPVLMAH